MDSICCSQNDFKSACSRFPSGVTITTVMGEGGLPYGITVSSFTSVSLSPPLVLVCIDQRSPVLQHIEVGKHFGINVLAAHQQELSIKFSRDRNDRFSGIQWSAGQTGVPLLSDVLASFECETVQMLVGGDHWILLGKVLHANSQNGEPLIYVNRCYACAKELQAG
ncbi:MAG: flavin reductase family protein [Acidobacteriia bacterium]|nr:flavin reductase family protein [Terriglobia bacterium]